MLPEDVMASWSVGLISTGRAKKLLNQERTEQRKDATMACQTCDHTMQRVNKDDTAVFWCSRCGTLKFTGSVPEFEAPKVVEKARALCEAVEEFPRMNLVNPARTLRECLQPNEE